MTEIKKDDKLLIHVHPWFGGVFFKLVKIYKHLSICFHQYEIEVIEILLCWREMVSTFLWNIISCSQELYLCLEYHPLYLIARLLRCIGKCMGRRNASRYWGEIMLVFIDQTLRRQSYIYESRKLSKLDKTRFMSLILVYSAISHLTFTNQHF